MLGGPQAVHPATMRIWQIAVVFLSFGLCCAGAIPAFSDSMRFYRAATGGNCVTCTWIAAEGVIEADSYRRYLEFLKDEGLLGAPGVNIHLNSPGGDLLGGVRLGLAFRQQQANTVISSARIRETYANGTVIVGDALPSECSSACAFAFAGGVSRFASRTTPAQEIGFQSIGRLGVHQFYDQRSLGDPSQRLFSGEDREDDQMIIALLLSYLSDMDVSAELLQLAAQTPPNEMHYLGEDELRRTRSDNRMVREVFINGYHNGVAITEIRYQRQEADYRLEVYCERGAMRILASIDYRGLYDVPAHHRWRIFDNMSLRDGTPVRVVSEEFSSTSAQNISLQVLFEFEQAPLSQMVRRKAFIFGDPSSRYASNAARALSFVLPGDFDGLYLLPRTCFGG